MAWVLVAGCTGGGTEPDRHPEPVRQQPVARTRETLDRCRAASVADAGRECIDAYRWIAESGSSIPEDAELYDRLGLGARSTGDMDAALRLWRVAMKQFPKYAHFYLRVGSLLLDQWSAGFEAYGPLMEAVRLEPRNGTAHRLLGDALQAMGRHREAADEYAAADTLLPPDWDLAWGQAHALIALERLHDALATLQAVEPLERAHFSGSLTAALRAEVVLRLGRPAEAERAFRAVLQRANVTDPELRAAWCGLSLALQQLRRSGEAREACRASRNIPPHGVADACRCSV
jgi:tetratricopeptide (TPR) repeat protein